MVDIRRPGHIYDWILELKAMVTPITGQFQLIFSVWLNKVQNKFTILFHMGVSSTICNVTISADQLQIPI